MNEYSNEALFERITELENFNDRLYEITSGFVGAEEIQMISELEEAYGIVAPDEWFDSIYWIEKELEKRGAM